MQIKNLIIGTPVEKLARRVSRFFAGSPASAVHDPGAINQVYDEQTVEVMERILSRYSNGIDIGCHTGAILTSILRCAPEGIHYAFEPLPYLYRQLVAEFPQVRVHDIALSDAAGETSFVHVLSNPGYSGMRERDYDRPNETTELIKVRMDRLDAVLPTDFPVRFIKIDVEGAELHVLRGAVDTLRRNKPFIVFEHGIGAADHYGATPEDIYALLVDQCGLRLTLMRRWLDGGPPLTRKAFLKQYYDHLNFYFMAYP
jgi:FkbM family methyltransferase